MGDAIPFVLSDIPGHISYTIIAVSYYLTNIYWLRVLAVVGLSLEIVYFQMSGGAMHTGIGWDLVFIIINLFQINRLVADRRKFRRMQDAHLLRQGVFAGFAETQLARLVTTGSWRTLEAGTRITTQGEPVNELILICQGKASVQVNGGTVALLRGGSFVGEMAFVSGNAASATVTVEQQIRAFVFDLGKLARLTESDDMVAVAMHRGIGRDLAAKLGNRNDSESITQAA